MYLNRENLFHLYLNYGHKFCLAFAFIVATLCCFHNSLQNPQMALQECYSKITQINNNRQNVKIPQERFFDYTSMSLQNWNTEYSFGPGISYTHVYQIVEDKPQIGNSQHVYNEIPIVHPPVQVQIVAEHNKIVVSWKPPTNDKDIVGYRLQKEHNHRQETIDLPKDITKYEDTEVEVDQEHQYRLQSYAYYFGRYSVYPEEKETILSGFTKRHTATPLSNYKIKVCGFFAVNDRKQVCLELSKWEKGKWYQVRVFVSENQKICHYKKFPEVGIVRFEPFWTLVEIVDTRNPKIKYRDAKGKIHEVTMETQKSSQK